MSKKQTLKTILIEVKSLHSSLGGMRRKMDAIHYLVDGQRAEMENHIQSLESKLNEALQVIASEHAVAKDRHYRKEGLD